MNGHRIALCSAGTLLVFVLLWPPRAPADTEFATIGAAASRVPSFLLEVPESVTDVLVADTGSATLYRFSVSGNRVIAQDERYMSIGQNGAGKQRAWDRKTPLGVYFITHRLDTSKLDTKYGDAAYPLDYPNAWDRHLNRTGYGIWLHGVDRNQPRRPPRDTDGCLSLPNEELLALTDYLRPMETPVVVARELRWLDAGDIERSRNEFHNALEAWRRSLEQQDLVSYLSLYDDEFSHNGMDKDTWSAYRLGVFSARSLSAVSISNLLLLADPEEPDLYLSRFTQVLTGTEGSVTTTKRLYWKRRPNAEWRIVSEDNG
jgi:murein L,D-transpeptidase YafK